MSEAIIIKKFKDGDPKARQTIYEMVFPLLLKYAKRLIGDEIKAEDIVQESWVKLLGMKDHKYKDLNGLKRLLYTITKNVCMDHLRKVKRENKGNNEYGFISAKTDQLENAVNIEAEYALLIEIIWKAIPLQPDQRRQVLEYMLIQGKEVKEIGELMGINKSGVYKHRDAFKEYLVKEEGIDPNDLPWPSDV